MGVAIVVSESHRRQGIASSLLREVIDQAEREGKSIVSDQRIWMQ